MKKCKVLSGEEIVAKGATKIETNLPELGLKYVVPNGSWLEQKQIQSAIEARKQLIEVERIEKCGNLSHAEWREDLQLAEVTQQSGGYWHFFGHSIGKKLYLRAEEALFLIEVNCLLLKYNEVTVSIQQAYSLLLHGKISLLQYKVYASLSRIGYKVYRHDNSGQNEKLFKNGTKDSVGKCEETATDVDSNNMDVDGGEKVNCDSENIVNSNAEVNNLVEDCMDTTDADVNSDRIAPSNVVGDNKMESDLVDEAKHDLPVIQTCSNEADTHNSVKQNISLPPTYTKLQKLEDRKLKQVNLSKFEGFEYIEDLHLKHITTVKAPDQKYLPKNVVLSKQHYLINMEHITTRQSRRVASDSRSYSMSSDEVSAPHVRRIRNLSTGDMPPNNYSAFNIRIPRPNFPHFFHYQFLQQSRFPFGLLFQRQFMANSNSMPRINNIFMRPPPLHPFSGYQSFYRNRPPSRKRPRAQDYHLEAIKNLASRLKQLMLSGNRHYDNLDSLNRLIETFNVRYKSRLVLTDQFDVIDNTVVDTIELDDDEDVEVRTKKRRMEDEGNNYNENYERIKGVALKLRLMQTENKVTARHRRALSNLIKTFNKSYKAEVHLNGNFEVCDPKQIVLDSSSDSDCVIEETPSTTGKKLKNPFNILKQKLTQQMVNSNPVQSTSQSAPVIHDNRYNDALKKSVGKYWLPDENDFGRAEVGLDANITECYRKEQYLFDFYKSQSCDFENWLDIKIAFYKSLQDSSILDDQPSVEIHLDSIIKPGDWTDMPSVLRKLSIIKSETDSPNETSLTIDFDVYNRDVQNFRKSNRPKPHFRIICICETSKLPSGNDVAWFNAKQTDDVPTGFAIVGLSSISYLQINSKDLPIYIPSNDLS